MEILHPERETNFKPELLPLFEAMKAGKTIKSVTCYLGKMNKNNRDKDLILENFIATEYDTALHHSDDGREKYDYVETNGKRGFYMHWVLSFKIDKEIVLISQ
jgi:hypothetical protein